MPDYVEKPKLSFIIWFSQRTCSTLLCRALESTGIAGRPAELLHHVAEPAGLYAKYRVSTPPDLQQSLWHIGSSSNGVFGLKYGFHQPFHAKLTDLLGQFPGCPKSASAWEVWANAFPNCKHIFMTRRNKVRLAVSWWKAIKSEEWHRRVGSLSAATNLTDAYDFNAINNLIIEVERREAGTQEFLATGQVSPYIVVYEDFIADYEGTVRRIVDFLGVAGNSPYPVAGPYYEKLADEVSEQWVHRYQEEKYCS